MLNTRFALESSAMISAIRDIVSNILLHCSISAPTDRRRLYVATFHRVLPEELRCQYPLPGLVVTPEELAWFIHQFREWFECNRLDISWEAVAHDEPSNRPRLAITFDDAQLDNYLYAAPVLDRYDIKATFFVPVEAVDRQQLLWHDRMGYTIQYLLQSQPTSPLLKRLGLHHAIAKATPQLGVSHAKRMSNAERLEWLHTAEGELPPTAPIWDGMMDWNQLRELIKRGHEVGSHSWTHPLLTDCDDRELEREVRESRFQLEQELGLTVRSFCYPDGNYDPRIVDRVRRAGYAVAVTTRWGTNSRGADAHALKRHDMVAEHSLDRRGQLSAARVAMRLAGFIRGAN